MIVLHSLVVVLGVGWFSGAGCGWAGPGVGVWLGVGVWCRVGVWLRFFAVCGLFSPTTGLFELLNI